MHKLVLFLALIALAGCTKPKEEETEASPAPVQVVEVKRDSIQRVVSGDGILYPVDQASVVPKVSAPIKTFYVRRGDQVTKGQLLATLENRDLEAAVAENKQLYDQAQATQRSTTAAQLPEDINKSQQDVTTAKESMDAAQRVYDSRKQLVEQGALARRLADEAFVTYVQARSQYEVATKHLQALENVSRPEQTKGVEAQTQAAKARYEAAQAQLSYSEVRSPIAGIIADRPLYAGEMAAAGAPLLTVMDVSRVIARANIPVRPGFCAEGWRQRDHRANRRCDRSRGESDGGKPGHGPQTAPRWRFGWKPKIPDCALSPEPRCGCRSSLRRSRTRW